MKSKTIESISFLSPLPTKLRWDLLPFGILYIITLFFAVYLPSEKRHYAVLTLPFIAFLNVLTVLLGHWSVNVRSFTQFKKIDDPADAQFAKIIPGLHKGAKQIVPLIHIKVDGKVQAIHFYFQKRKYTYDFEKKRFEKPRYPVSNSMAFYKKAKGIENEAVALAKKNYGLNKFDIPLPKFWDLFREHALAPFFVFQVFCVGLWCLDEYWYYSLFTLFMLFCFEATVVKQRIRNLMHLRGMRAQPQNVYVFRSGKWKQISSEELVPGDIISLTRQNEGLVSPCDVLILEGTCVVNEALLTGESTPQIKEGIKHRADEDELNIRKKDKGHVIFGGTRILQHMPSPNAKNPPPNNGCIGFVLRTGFETSQGKLIRTILFSNERVTAHNLETLLFILFLLVFAIVASGYVLLKGLEDPNRSRYKLFLECALIITSVVPPELPMELSLAVNASLLALSKLGIFCTEPFRIPFAGKVDVCCFDKTGTLTSDNMILSGIAGLTTSTKKEAASASTTTGEATTETKGKGDNDALIDGSEAPLNTMFVLAGCHSLVTVDNEIVGDPMEKAALKGINWELAGNDVCKSVGTIKGRKQPTVRILNRYAFSSELKRMSTIVAVEADSNSIMALIKGAPEAIKGMFTWVPDDYDETFKHFTSEGYRVLALGYRKMTNEVTSVGQAKNIPRKEVEKDMTFAGFAIFTCPIKPDTAETITNLLNSSHHVVMITGDNALTASHVARDLNIVSRPVRILGTAEQDPEPVWSSVDGLTKVPVSAAQDFWKEYDLCVSGEALATMLDRDPKWLVNWVRRVNVFARTSPEQKEIILSTMKYVGFSTLMCGDGTNDVGALKQADVGVAILNRPIKTDPQQQQQQPLHQAPSGATFATPTTVTATVATPGTPTPAGAIGNNNHAQRRLAAAQQQQHAQAQRRRPKTLRELMEEANAEEHTIRLGDASIASPFTSKTSSIASVADIIRQGRCTLVTTMQMYKILALNCLISAYSLSVLYLDGVKFGDGQMMLSGMVIVACFLFISRANPIKELSAERPHTRIFSPYVMLSILGQFAIHLYTLVRSVSLAKAATPPSDEPIDLEKEFEPNLLNSVIFLMMTIQQVATFANNYRGRPFMESLTENRPLLYSLGGLASLVIIAASEISKDFNEYLQLVPLPSAEFRSALIGLMLIDIVGVFVLERVLLKVFKNKPKKNFHLQ